jgi:hypothetical protein
MNERAKERTTNALHCQSPNQGCTQTPKNIQLQALFLIQDEAEVGESPISEDGEEDRVAVSEKSLDSRILNPRKSNFGIWNPFSLMSSSSWVLHVSAELSASCRFSLASVSNFLSDFDMASCGSLM